MSCYEWEEGTIKIPARQWREFAEQLVVFQGGKFTDLKEKKRISYDLDDATLTLDHEQQTVTWSVSENNHAVENARDHALARILFRALGGIKWTRGSGGEIVGNDEYNRDDRHAGGGGNYVTSYYGPERKRRGTKPLRFR